MRWWLLAQSSLCALQVVSKCLFFFALLNGHVTSFACGDCVQLEITEKRLIVGLNEINGFVIRGPLWVTHAHGSLTLFCN